MYKIKQHIYLYVIMEPLNCGKIMKNLVLMTEIILGLNTSFTHFMETGICVSSV